MENGLLRIIILDSRNYFHGIREVFPESPSLLVSGYLLRTQDPLKILSPQAIIRLGYYTFYWYDLYDL